MGLKKVATILLIIGSGFSIFSCTELEPGLPERTDDFNRKSMLEFLSDEVIIPAYEVYREQLLFLQETNEDFVSSPSAESLADLQKAWLNAYKAWQHVAVFQIGKAEEINYRNYVNIYPTDTSKILDHINGSEFNLELPSNFDAQGFPALDYLLYGLSKNEIDRHNKLSQNNYAAHITLLIDRLEDLNELVLQDWKNTFRQSFINNDGSSATASVDKFVNDFLYYFERFFRAGKVGIPAGVFTGSPLSNTVEAPYSEIFSKSLFEEAFNAVRNVFNGVAFDQLSTGPGMMQYLEYIQQANQLSNLAEDIQNQWTRIELALDPINDNYRNQIETDIAPMLGLYDEIQKTVVLLKVDMMQALNIQVDYVDADGD